MPERARQSSSHSSVKARILLSSVTKRRPAFTKKEIRPTTCGKSSGGTWPESRSESSTAPAVASAKASSCTGLAPASCRGRSDERRGGQETVRQGRSRGAAVHKKKK